MPRKVKTKVKINNIDSLTTIMQETYDDACLLITEAQSAINILTTSTTAEDVEDATKIAKAKTDLLKLKDSGAKLKLSIATLQSNIMKDNGNSETTNESFVGASMDELKSIREMFKFDKLNDKN